MAKLRVTPVILVTGFLGAGKTTILSRWLRTPALAGAMVIVNEFGAVGIDDRLIQTSGEMVLLENGCACCMASDDLAAALERLFWRQLERDIPPMSCVLIETTGVAEPSPIAAMLADHALLRERFRLAGIVTVVDAQAGPGQAAAHPECRHQIEAATLVLVSKVDRATQAEIAATEDLVRRLAPAATLLPSAHGSAAIEPVLEALAQPRPGPEAGHDAPHDHRHAATVDSAFLPLPDPVDGARLSAAAAAAAARYGAELLRLKGIVRLAGGAESSIQLEPGGVHAAGLASPPPPGEQRHGITVITRGRAAAEVVAFLAEGTAREHAAAVAGEGG